MKTIHKYQLKFSLIRQSVELPTGSIIISFLIQNGIPTIWALVDTDKEEKVERAFHLVGTGHVFQEKKYDLKYHGTVQQGVYVWHLFEELPIASEPQKIHV